MSKNTSVFDRYFLPFDSVGDYLDAMHSTESVSPFETVAEHERGAVLLTAMWVALGERERDVVRRRWGLHGHAPQTQAEIAGQYGISRKRISDIERRAGTKLCVALDHWAATGRFK